ncbi:MAG TPA: triple tyrosine motif-containing protein, partial [Chitinophagaceae bacterium]|nr:triple tyrosine motif-containing protein [Chitinophagaceae bacterium]
MPSLDGLVQFRPEEVLPMLPDKPIFIDEVKADTQLVAANTQLPASFNQLVIKISSPYFGNPYNQYLEYNLKGLDDNWYPVNINNVITFNQLPKGNYQLCIRKKSGFGVHQYIVATFSFSVAPAFNETLGFRIGLILLIFILSYLFLRLRYRYVIRQKNKLQREVAFHTREQKRLIDELYFNSKIYRKISQVISHDLRSPLRFLHLISRSLPADLREGDPVEVSKSISEIKTTSGQVVHFIEDFHLWVSTFNASFEPDNQNCSLALLVSELQEFFREMLQARNNSLVSHIKEDDYLFTDRQLLKIILRNLIDNANKYMANGSIHITLETLNGRCNIKIQ